MVGFIFMIRKFLVSEITDPFRSENRYNVTTTPLEWNRGRPGTLVGDESKEKRCLDRHDRTRVESTRHRGDWVGTEIETGTGCKITRKSVGHYWEVGLEVEDPSRVFPSMYR